jgi:hypothetical protein
MFVWDEEENSFELSAGIKDERSGELRCPVCGCCTLSLHEVTPLILFEQLDDKKTPKRKLVCAGGCTRKKRHA